MTGTPSTDGNLDWIKPHTKRSLALCYESTLAENRRLTAECDALRQAERSAYLQGLEDAANIANSLGEHGSREAIRDARSAALTQPTGEPRINWRDDPNAIVEDDEMDVRGGPDCA